MSSTQEELAERHADLTYEIKQKKDELVLIEQILTDHIDTESAGEHEFELDNAIVSVKVPDNWKWDSDALRAIVGAMEAHPAEVTAKFTINKSKFMDLPDMDKANYIPALTRKAGKPAIKVNLK